MDKEELQVIGEILETQRKHIAILDEQILKQKVLILEQQKIIDSHRQSIELLNEKVDDNEKSIAYLYEELNRKEVL